MVAANILMITTSADKMRNGEATGVWLEELTTPYYAFIDAGAKVTLSSISGGAVPIDARSIAPAGENEDSVERYLKDAATQQLANNTPVFSEIDTGKYDAVFLPGGHGTMFDYPGSGPLADLLEEFSSNNKVVAAVCHGPAGLISAKAPSGIPFVSGKRIAAFTDSEEHAVGLQDAVPFLLETKLKSLGAEHVAAPDFEAFAIRDGNLITGQNPASATRTAELVLEVITENKIQGE